MTKCSNGFCSVYICVCQNYKVVSKFLGYSALISFVISLCYCNEFHYQNLRLFWRLNLIELFWSMNVVQLIPSFVFSNSLSANGGAVQDTHCPISLFGGICGVCGLWIQYLCMAYKATSSFCRLEGSVNSGMKHPRIVT